MSENEYTVSYVAKKAQGKDDCTGCCHTWMSDSCNAAPACSPSQRKDKRAIIWVVKK